MINARSFWTGGSVNPRSLLVSMLVDTFTERFCYKLSSKRDSCAVWGFYIVLQCSAAPPTSSSPSPQSPLATLYVYNGQEFSDDCPAKGPPSPDQ
jgi:hypothetical protein